MVTMVTSREVLVLAGMSVLIFVQGQVAANQALTVVLCYSSLCGAPDSVGWEGAGKKTAAICTDIMGGVVWVVLRCKDNPLAPTQIPLTYLHVNTYVDQ